MSFAEDWFYQTQYSQQTATQKDQPLGAGI